MYSATPFWSKRVRIYECEGAKLQLLGASKLLCVDISVRNKFLMVRFIASHPIKDPYSIVDASTLARKSI